MDVHGGIWTALYKFLPCDVLKSWQEKEPRQKSGKTSKDFPRVTPGSCEEHYTVAPDSGKSFLG
jgi:hypothetical protein